MSLIGVLLVVVVLWDAFETMILPRRLTRRLRLTRVIYLLTWTPWAAVARRETNGNRRESFLSVYGPASLLLLLGTWAALLMVGFATIQWGLGSPLSDPVDRPGFSTDLYMSGTTFVTLGLGDVVPRTGEARLATIAEAGTGFAFLALVIGYLPVLYQSFSRRWESTAWDQVDHGASPLVIES